MAQVGALRAAGRGRAADDLCRRIIAAHPEHGPAWEELARSVLAQGDAGQAERLLRQALRRVTDPSLDQALGVLLLGCGRAADALEPLGHAVRQLPGSAGAVANLGLALHRCGRRGEAIACYERALALDPGLVHTRSNLASACKDAGDTAAALAHYQQALAGTPRSPWLISNLLWTSCHDGTLPARALYERHRELGGRFGGPVPFSGAPAGPREGRKLRVGLVSADLCSHAVAFYLLPVLQGLDRDRFEVHAYAGNGTADAMSAALRQACDGWVEASRLDDDALHRRIGADGIDVLLDLSGHTAGNRLPVFARRAAPVQAAWIGYPCTTGLAAMDYLLSDAVLTPVGLADELFAERIVRMPGAVGFQLPDPSADAGPLPALARGHLTFGGFHRPSKLTPATLQAWAGLLRELPSARLLLAHCDDDATRDALRGRFAALGVAPDRLDLRPRLPFHDYLALHREVDLVLDAVGYSGGTTTLHALSMGVPVLAVAGVAMPARQSAAILVHAGLGGFVAASPEGLAGLGLQWAGRLEDLASIRAGLRGRLEGLRLLREAPRLFGRAVEAMWDRHAAGLPPAALHVDADGTVSAGVEAAP